MILIHVFMMKTHSGYALWSKYTFEGSYISPRLGVLHPTWRMKRKEKKLTKNEVLYMKNDQSLPSFFQASQY